MAHSVTSPPSSDALQKGGGFKPSFLSLDLELAKRYLAALVKAVFPVAADKAWNLGIVVGRNAIIVEIVEQGEKAAADARAA
jgi:hypothetical protein